MISLARLKLRLLEKSLWWKHSWWFQLAHGPLCDRYRHNTFKIGSFYLCRSCTLLYPASIITLGATFWFQPELVPILIAAYSLLPILLFASYPWIYRKIPRLIRDAIRIGTGIFSGFLFSLLLTSWFWLSLATFAGLFVVFKFFQAKRKHVKQTECNGCPELGGNAVCSGYQQQADSIRNYRACLEEEYNKPGVISLLIPKADYNGHLRSNKEA